MVLSMREPMTVAAAMPVSCLVSFWAKGNAGYFAADCCARDYHFNKVANPVV